MRKCKVCGATFTGGETHCPYCGANLITGKPDGPPPGKEKKAGQAHRPHDGASENRKAGWSPFREPPKQQKAKEPEESRGFTPGPPPLKMFRRVDNLIAAILAFALGTFGVQWFFLGQPKKGMRRLLFFWTGIPTIMGLVEGAVFLGKFVRDDLPLLP